MLMFGGLGSSCRAFRTHVPLPNGQWVYYQQGGDCSVETRVVPTRNTVNGADDAGGGSNLGLYITSGLIIGVGVLIAWAQGKGT